MRRTVLVVGLVLLLASGAFAYTSDRMDFGEIDFGGETVYFLAHWDAIAQFEEGGGRAGILQEAMELFNIGGYEKVTVGWGDVAAHRPEPFHVGRIKI